MKKKIKTLPAVMTVLSVLYLVYVVLSESTTLVADTVGGDPGGKVLPTIIALFLIGGFLTITIKERPTEESMDKETTALFAITVILSVLYVLLTKVVGFIILTTIILYTLEYLYTSIGKERRVLPAVLGGISSVALVTAIYTVMRLISKSIIRMGKNGALPAVFGKNSMAAVICLIYLTIVVILLVFCLVRPLKKKNLEVEANAAIISITVVLFLYVVFKQLFLVGLAQGLLKF